MATLAELYDFLENKQNNNQIDSAFSYDTFLPEEWPKARLEILLWREIEQLVEDESCSIDRDTTVTYFNQRIKATHNQLIKYRYNYFIYLLTNNNSYAKESINALMMVIDTLLPKDKEDYPHQAENALSILMVLTKKVKDKISEAAKLIWDVLESDYGYRTKIVCLRLAKEKSFLSKQ